MSKEICDDCGKVWYECLCFTLADEDDDFDYDDESFFDDEYGERDERLGFPEDEDDDR